MDEAQQLHPLKHLYLRIPVQEGLVTCGSFDNKTNSLVFITSDGDLEKSRLMVHNPLRPLGKNRSITNEQLSFNQTVNCLNTYKDNNHHCNLLVGFGNSLLSYDVHNHKDVWFADIPDSVNTILDDEQNNMILLGCNENIKYISKNNGKIMSHLKIKNKSIFSLCHADVNNDGVYELVVGTDDDVKMYNGTKCIQSLQETDVVSNLIQVDKRSVGYALAAGTIGIYRYMKRNWALKGKSVPIAIKKYDFTGDGQYELVVGWEDGQLTVYDTSSMAGGDILYYDTFSAGISGVENVDYLADGHDSILAISNRGEIRTYISQKNVENLPPVIKVEKKLEKETIEQIDNLKIEEEKQEIIKDNDELILDADFDEDLEDFEEIDQGPAFTSASSPKTINAKSFSNSPKNMYLEPRLASNTPPRRKSQNSQQIKTNFKLEM